MFKILMVDDSKSVHAFVRSLLRERADVALTSAMHGQEAIEKLAAEDAFDLILLDWEMPVMNGPETLRHLVAMRQKAPVIMMTTKSAPTEIQAMLEAGASEYIMKPFTVDILLEKMAFVTGGDFKNAA